MLLLRYHYAEESNQLAGFIFRAIVPTGKIADFFDQISQHWRAVGNSRLYLIGREFETQSFRSSKNCVIPGPARWSNTNNKYNILFL